MKKLVFITLISAFGIFAMQAGELVKKGETGTPLGSYAISETDDFVEVDGKSLPTYIISFQNSDQVIRVAVDEDKGIGFKERRYVVLGDNLNLQYVCKRSHFGVEKLDEKYVKAGFEPTSENLDMGAYYHQKILTKSKRINRDCLGLIACYYPQLIKNFETTLAINK